MWMNLENILSERRPLIIEFHLYEIFRIGKSIEIECRLVFATE
jgi:hypothetical protein